MDKRAVLICIFIVQVLGFVIADEDEELTALYGDCPEEWFPHGLSCYLFSATAATWIDAASQCVESNAHLVYIDDDMENTFIYGFLKTGQRAWLGLRKAVIHQADQLDNPRRYNTISKIAPSGAEWLWTPSSEFLSAKKIVNETRIQYWRLEGDQECGAMQNEGVWVDVDCSESLPFLCEMPIPCAVGFFSDYSGETTCTSQCHCLKGEPCEQRTGRCPRGCASGWTGKTCSLPSAMPEATYHCFRTPDNSLRADLTVNTRGRMFTHVQLVNQDGNPLNCDFKNTMHERDKAVVTTLYLHGAFNHTTPQDKDNSSSNATQHQSSSSSNSNATLTKSDSSSNATQHQSSSSSNSNVTLTESDSSSNATQGQNNSSSDDTLTGSNSVSNGTHTDANEANTNANADTSEYNTANGTESKDIGRRSAEESCGASRTDDGVVKWLVEFKKFKGILTGSDVIVEVTCQLNDVDELEVEDSIVDDSAREDPLQGENASVEVAAYFADAYSGERQDRIHLGQTLRMIVEVRGKQYWECATLYDCFVWSKKSQDQKYQLLDKDGCPVEGSPVERVFTAGDGAMFTSNPFSAFSLGSTEVKLDCKVDVFFGGYPNACAKRSCLG